MKKLPLVALPLLLGACDPTGDRFLFPEAEQRQVSHESRRKVEKVLCPTPQEAMRQLDDALNYAEENPDKVPSLENLEDGIRTVDVVRENTTNEKMVVHETIAGPNGEFTYFHIDPKDEKLFYSSSLIGGGCFLDVPKKNLEANERRAKEIEKAKKGQKGKRGKK